MFFVSQYDGTKLVRECGKLLQSVCNIPWVTPVTNLVAPQDTPVLRDLRII